MRRRTLIPLIILPLIVGILTWYLTSMHGPYWVFEQDPEYAYLLNGLNFARFHCCVYHIDHPGTPLQMMIGGVIKISYQFRQLQTKDSLPSDVLKNPEWYLAVMHSLLVVLNLSGLLALGLVAYRHTKNLTLALMLQLTPLLSITTLTESFLRVTPEPLLFFFIILLEIGLCELLFNAQWSKRLLSLTVSLSYQQRAKVLLSMGFPLLPIIFGLITGVGLATKLTFIPIPIFFLLVLPKLSQKFAFLIWTIIGFFAGTFPIWHLLSGVFLWSSNLLNHKSGYGHGDAGYVDWQLFLSNLATMIKTDPLYFIQLIAFPVLLMASVLKQSRDTVVKLRKPLVLFVSLFVVELISVAITAKLKTSTNRYMLPGLVLSGFSLFLFSWFLRKRTWAKLLLIFWIICELLLRVGDLHIYTREITDRKTNQYANSSVVYAVIFGNEWSGKLSSDILTQVYK